MLMNYFKFSKVSLLISSILLSSISLSASSIILSDNQIQKLEDVININSNTTDALGVEVYLLEDSSRLINNTTIKSTIMSSKNDVYSSGIYFDSHGDSIGMTGESQLINEKEIIVQSNGNNEVFSDAININYLSDNTKLINNGSINATSIGEENVDAVGIALNSLNNNSSIVNNGIIKASAQAPIWGKAIGIFISGINDEDYYDCTTGESCMNGNSSIVNNGTIEVSTITKTGEAIGISHYGEMIDESKIVNSNTGIINVISEYGKDGVGLPNEDFAQSFGISVSSMRNKSSIVNEGTILVDSKNISKEAKNYNFGIATDSMFDETFIINSGKVEVKINDKLDYRASSIFNYYSENSTIVNEKEGQLSGNIVLLADKNTRDNGDITLNNKGFISLPYNANKDAIVLNDDENRVDSMRPYIPNLVNSGTIEIGAFKDSAGNIENTQILTRNATFEKGSKMQVAVMSGSEAFNLGDTLAAVVKSIDKLTVNELILNQTKLVDNSATLDFEYKIVDENQIDLFVSNVNKISDVIIDDKDNNQNTDNKIPIAIILDKYRDNPTFGSIISKIDAMESASEISKAMDSIVPTISSSLLNTSSQITSSILNIVSNRLGNIKFGLNSGDEIISDDDRVWVKAFGSLGEQKDKDSIYGFDLKTYGVAIGYDKEYEYEQVIGLAAFYTNANVETNHVNHTNNIDAYSIVAYGSNLLIDNKTTIYYQASNTWQRNDSKREIFTGEIADSKFTSKALALDLKVGHEININENLSVEPKIGTTYKHFVNPSYKENGAGVLNVQSNKFTSSEFIGNIGTDVEYKMTDNSKLIASVGAGYNFRKSNRNITSSFEGTPDVIFDTKGIDNGRWKYHAGIGYDLTFDNQSNFNVFYKYLGEGSKYSNNVVTLNYIYKF